MKTRLRNDSVSAAACDTRFASERRRWENKPSDSNRPQAKTAKASRKQGRVESIIH